MKKKKSWRLYASKGASLAGLTVPSWVFTEKPFIQYVKYWYDSNCTLMPECNFPRVFSLDNSAYIQHTFYCILISRYLWNVHFIHEIPHSNSRIDLQVLMAISYKSDTISNRSDTISYKSDTISNRSDHEKNNCLMLQQIWTLLIINDIGLFTRGPGYFLDSGLLVSTLMV